MFHPLLKTCNVLAGLQCDTRKRPNALCCAALNRWGVLQFELHCRPFHIVGFNAHDLVVKALINPWEYSTESKQSCTSALEIILAQ